MTMTLKQRLRHWLANELQVVMLSGFKGYFASKWTKLMGQKFGLVVGALLMLLVVSPTFGAEPAPVWKLVRSNQVQAANYASPQACLDALYAAQVSSGQQVTFRCQTTIVRTGAAPAPVNCAVSNWGAWTGGTWSACSNGQQSRTETRARTITTQPANGGTPCPALTETRTAMQACTVTPPPQTATGNYETGPLTATLAGTYARWPGYSAAIAGPIGNVSGGTMYDDDPRTIGTRDGLWVAGIGQGFSFTVQGGTTPRTLKVYVGGWNAGATFTAGSYTHTVANKADGWNAVYTVTFTGNLSVSWRMASGTGNVTIQAAALDQVAAPPATGTASLSWQRPAQYTDGTPLPFADVARFRVYQGASASGLQRIGETEGTTFAVGQLPSGTHFFAVSAVSAAGVESGLSEVRSKTIP